MLLCSYPTSHNEDRMQLLRIAALWTRAESEDCHKNWNKYWRDLVGGASGRPGKDALSRDRDALIDRL
jgi:hypothetical protein